MRIDNPNITGSLTYGDGSIVSASFSESSSIAIQADSTTSASVAGTADTASVSISSSQAENSDSSSFSESSSITSHIENYNTTSGSLSLWQGSQAEYNAISNSSDPNTLYFVR